MLAGILETVPERHKPIAQVLRHILRNIRPSWTCADWQSDRHRTLHTYEQCCLRLEFCGAYRRRCGQRGRRDPSIGAAHWSTVGLRATEAESVRESQYSVVSVCSKLAMT